MDYRCVQCGFVVKTLYIQYSPGNIRLIKCANCKSVADEYIECEIMILIIDLILHKPKAYRHLFFNMFSTNQLHLQGILWKLALAYLFLDACIHPLLFLIYAKVIDTVKMVIRKEGTDCLQVIMYVLTASERESSSSPSLNSSPGIHVKIIVDVIFGNLACFGAILAGTKEILNSSTDNLRHKDILLAILVSSYFKIFLVTMMVWNFPTSVVFIIDIFVLSSNTMALQVLSDATMFRCALVALIANALKFLLSCGLGIVSCSHLFQTTLALQSTWPT